MANDIGAPGSGEVVAESAAPKVAPQPRTPDEFDDAAFFVRACAYTQDFGVRTQQAMHPSYYDAEV
jgi:hypothetical protein